MLKVLNTRMCKNPAFLEVMFFLWRLNYSNPKVWSPNPAKPVKPDHFALELLPHLEGQGALVRRCMIRISGVIMWLLNPTRECLVPPSPTERTLKVSYDMTVLGSY